MTSTTDTSRLGQVPEPSSYVENSMITFHQVKSSNTLSAFFDLPLSKTAFHQLNELQHLLVLVPISASVDLYMVIHLWLPYFSPGRAYRHLFGHILYTPIVGV